MTDTKPTLAQLCVDTPSKPMTPLDHDLARYTAGLPSTPPPPEVQAAKVAVLDVVPRDRLDSGTFNVDELIRQAALAGYKQASVDFTRQREEDRKANMQTAIYLPTAIVVSVLLIGYFTLLALHVDVPGPVVAIVGALGSLALPRLFPKGLSGGPS